MNHARATGRSRIILIAAWTTLIVAVVWLIWRGVWRGLDGAGDLAVRYHAAVRWLADGDPYAFAEGYGLGPQTINLDPPGTLLGFIPLTALTWPDARIVGTFIGVASTAFIAVSVCRLAGWRVTSAKSLFLIAFLLAFAPVIAALALGQSSLVAVAAILAAVMLERSGRGTASGVMFGLACVLKFTVGLPFLAYLFWRRRWSPALAGAAVVAGFTVASVARMSLSGTPWLDSWIANLRVVSGQGGLNSPGLDNEARLSLVNLQYPLTAIVGDDLLVDGLAFVCIGAAALAFMWLRRGRDAHPDLLALATVAVLGLLVTYHRYYDAVVVAVPVAWACSALATPSRRVAIVVLALCATFAMPIQSLADSLARQSAFVPDWLTESPLWTGGVLAAHSWTLVAMTVLLLAAAARDRGPALTVADAVREPPSAAPRRSQGFDRA